MRPKIFLLIFSFFFTGLLFCQNNIDGNIRKIVIDAGHGGKDPGAISRDRKYYEKNITLSVALTLGKMISEAYPEINVIYTRKTDVFIPLNVRTQIANKNKADLFISIHVNSARSTEASGTETFVMGVDKSSSNMEVSKLENSVVVFEDDYTSNYQGFDPENPESYIIFSLLQNSHLEQSLDLAVSIQNSLTGGPIKKSRGIKQAGFLVLWRATMPSVLIELGFISNYTDYKILADKESHTIFAEQIFKAFSKYKTKFDIQDSTKVSAKTRIVKEPKTLPAESQDSNRIYKIATIEKEKIESFGESSPIYMIQFLAASKKITQSSPELKGINNSEIIKIGKYYKYFVGKYTNFEEAKIGLKKYSRIFPQAFIVKKFNEEIIPAKE